MQPCARALWAPARPARLSAHQVLAQEAGELIIVPADQVGQLHLRRHRVRGRVRRRFDLVRVRARARARVRVRARARASVRVSRRRLDLVGAEHAQVQHLHLVGLVGLRPDLARRDRALVRVRVGVRV